jgi:Fe-S cluster biogenesis protein NfuA
MTERTASELREAVEEWLQRELPIIQMHGGTSAVHEADPETGEVVVELGGGCAGCEVSEVTSGNIEAGLLAEFPEVAEVSVRVPDDDAFGARGGGGSVMGIDRTEGGRG